MKPIPIDSRHLERAVLWPPADRNLPTVLSSLSDAERAALIFQFLVPAIETRLGPTCSYWIPSCLEQKTGQRRSEVKQSLQLPFDDLRIKVERGFKVH